MTVLTLNPRPLAVRKAQGDHQVLRWIIFLALLSGFGYLGLRSHRFDFGVSEEDNIARHLERGDGFRSAYDESPHAPPTSWSPPVFPLLLSVAFRILGEQTRAIAAVAAFNVLCRGACAAAMFVLGKQFYDRNTGALAAGLFLAHPMFLHVVDSVWDNYLALAMFLWLLCWTIRLSRSDQVSKMQFAGLGAALALLLLTNTSYVLACPAIVLVSAARQNWPRRAILASVAAIAAIVVLAPWTIRNYLAFDRLFLVRGNANVELWLGNQACGYGWMQPAVLDSHPSRNPAERRLLLQEGETKYFELCGQRFAEEYRAAPARFWFLCGERVVHAFINDTGPSGAYISQDIYIDRYFINGFVATAGLAGVWMAWRLRLRATYLFGIAVLSIAPYLVTQLYNRYAMPLRAILVLFAAYLIVRLYVISRRLTG
jgi:4-amino-4-deoxy-L-arabinose transferase-like glycosyltransferase